MIFDFIQNIQRYPKIPYLRDIQKFISERDCMKIPDGEHEIVGRNFLVRVAEYETGPAEEKMFEAHTVYADLQYVIQGREIMGVSLEKNPEPATAYDEKADIRFFKTPAEFSLQTVSAGQFTFFFPGELHRPGCHPGAAPSKVKKLVFKIKIA